MTTTYASSTREVASEVSTPGDVQLSAAGANSEHSGLQLPATAARMAGGRFKVWLNPAVTEGLKSEELKALQLEFADWFPGPVLIPECRVPECKHRTPDCGGTEVQLDHRIDKKTPAGNTLPRSWKGPLPCRVVKHSAEDPRGVEVFLPWPDKDETVLFSHSSLKIPTLNQEHPMDQRIEDVLSFLWDDDFEDMLSTLNLRYTRTRFTVIGYSEFVCGSKAEQEYWLVNLDNSVPLSLPIRAGQIPMHFNPQGSHEFCVVHVQYSGAHLEPAQVERVAVRVTQAIEVRAHQDKCRPCAAFVDRLGLGWKSRSKKPVPGVEILNEALADTILQMTSIQTQPRIFLTRAELDNLELDNLTHGSYIKVGAKFFQPDVDCDYCTDFKWSSAYGKQYVGPSECSAVEALYSRKTHVCCAWEQSLDVHEQTLSLDDGHQRRFALVVGNGQFCKPLDALPSAIKDAELVASRLKDLEFRVHTDRPLTNQTKDDLEREVKAWTRTLPGNAQALVFLSGHGKEVHGKQYFVTKDFKYDKNLVDTTLGVEWKQVGLEKPLTGNRIQNESLALALLGKLDFTQKEWAKFNVLDLSYDRYIKAGDSYFKPADKLVITVKQMCVGLEWIQERVMNVLEKDGLLMSFWDCCREDELKAAEEIRAMRGETGSAPMIHYMPKLNKKLGQTDSDSAAWVTVFASTSASFAFSEDNGYLTRALLAWWHNDTWIALDILDVFAKAYLDKIVAVSCARQVVTRRQMLDWHFGGTPKFTFKDEVRVAGNKDDALPDASSLKEVWAPEPKWADLPNPKIPALPFCILFVGANKKSEAQLSLEKEVEQMKMHFNHKEGLRHWAGRVNFVHSCFASKDKFTTEMRVHDPVILHFACHGHESALSLFEDNLAADDLVDFMKEWTANGNGKKLQLIIANACNSNHIARALGEHVDFVIGHEGRVGDSEAISFARELYGSLGAGESLQLSFIAAKLVSSRYLMIGKKNAAGFKLLLPASNGDIGRQENAVESGFLPPLDDSDCCELEIFLRNKGLKKSSAAKFCNEVGLETVEQFKKLNEEQFALSEFGYLKNMQKKELYALTTDGIARLFRRNDDGPEPLSLTNTRNDSLDSNYVSGADTVSESSLTFKSVDDGCELVATKHSGNPEEFHEYMQRFILDFVEYLWIIADTIDPVTQTFMPAGLAKGSSWTLCMLVWMRFAKEACFDESEQQRWLATCYGSPTQEDMLNVLESILMHKKTALPLWDCNKFERVGFDKSFSAALFVTDMMVQRHLQGHAEMIRQWEQDIVNIWFRNDETASDFLNRANRFLRTQIDGIGAVVHVVKIQSYVAFLRMSKLASLLLFEYLEVRKFEESSTAGPAKQRSGASPDLMHGFSSFVSSAGHVFRLSNTDMPARDAVPTIVQGLRCMAHLRDSKWNVKTTREFLPANLLQFSAPDQATTVHI